MKTLTTIKSTNNPPEKYFREPNSGRAIGMLDKISDKLAAIAQPLPEFLLFLTVHQAIPFRNATTAGIARTRVARAVTAITIIFSKGVIVGRMLSIPDSCERRKAKGIVPKETKRNNRAKFPKQPHKNLLSLTIVFTTPIGRNLAGAIQDLFRHPDTIHSVTQP
ncbi:MAG: hypothetical protein WB425_00605 [Terracidiphilus sp.]